MIRPAVIAVLAFLALGLVVFLLWPYLTAIFQDPVPAGQYPLNEPRPEWPVTERVRPYSPGASMGCNKAIGANVTGPKVDCMKGFC